MNELLASHGIINPDRIVQISDSVRDRKDVSVMMCEESGVIFLSSSDHIKNSYYTDKKGCEYWADSWDESLKLTRCDDDRRKSQFLNQLKNKSVLDYGCGNGGFLKAITNAADRVCGLEVQLDMVDMLNNNGIDAVSRIDDVRGEFDVVTMWHVLEHLPDPVEQLTKVKDKIGAGGKIIVEVPHANDFLIKRCKNPDFMKFTFWSEHLILHTKGSLYKFLEVSGYKNIHIKGHQRYPLSNHLYWLSEGKPNGHNIWGDIDGELLNNYYIQKLCQLDMTDTLIATAYKN